MSDVEQDFQRFLHPDRQAEPAERCDQTVNNGMGEPTECGKTWPCEIHTPAEPTTAAHDHETLRAYLDTADPINAETALALLDIDEAEARQPYRQAAPDEPTTAAGRRYALHPPGSLDEWERAILAIEAEARQPSGQKA